MAAWKEAPEVKEIARTLIWDHHAHLQVFFDKMRFVFRDEAQKSKGRTIAGKAHKISGMAAYLAEATKDEPRVTHIPEREFDGEVIPAHDYELFDGPEFFLMEIAADIWRRLEDWQHIALVDHELYHFTIEMKDDGPALGIRGHDLEEFVEVLVRYGRWDKDLQEFTDAWQMRLDLEEGPAGEDPSQDEIDRVLRKLGRLDYEPSGASRAATGSPP